MEQTLWDIKKILNKIDIITYVPISKHRLKQRSFNQSQRLAEEISKIIKKPVVECLVKNFDTHEQKFLSYDERQSNLKSCFTLKNKHLICNICENNRQYPSDGIVNISINSH